jgi:hypothetical protein
MPAELQHIDSEYAEAIADAGPLASLRTAFKVREQRRDAIRAESVSRLSMACVKGRPSTPPAAIAGR